MGGFIEELDSNNEGSDEIIDDEDEDQVYKKSFIISHKYLWLPSSKFLLCLI